MIKYCFVDFDNYKFMLKCHTDAVSNLKVGLMQYFRDAKLNAVTRNDMSDVDRISMFRDLDIVHEQDIPKILRAVSERHTFSSTPYLKMVA